MLCVYLLFICLMLAMNGCMIVVFGQCNGSAVVFVFRWKGVSPGPPSAFFLCPPLIAVVSSLR